MDLQGEPQQGHELDEIVDDTDEPETTLDWRIEGNDDESDGDEDEEVENQILVDMGLSKDGRVRENIPRKKMHILANYIAAQQKKFMDDYLLQNQLAPTEIHQVRMFIL